MKYIIVAARLDSTSWFVDQVPGANNRATGIVTLLYAAKLLKTLVLEYKNYNKNVMFLLLSGESYIGVTLDLRGLSTISIRTASRPLIFNDNDESLSTLQFDDIQLNQLSKTSGKTSARAFLPGKNTCIVFCRREQSSRPKNCNQVYLLNFLQGNYLKILFLMCWRVKCNKFVSWSLTSKLADIIFSTLYYLLADRSSN